MANPRPASFEDFLSELLTALSNPTEGDGLPSPAEVGRETQEDIGALERLNALAQGLSSVLDPFKNELGVSIAETAGTLQSDPVTPEDLKKRETFEKNWKPFNDLLCKTVGESGVKEAFCRDKIDKILFRHKGVLGRLAEKALSEEETASLVQDLFTKVREHETKGSGERA